MTQYHVFEGSRAIDVAEARLTDWKNRTEEARMSVSRGDFSATEAAGGCKHAC